MMRIAAIVPSLGASPCAAELLASWRRELATHKDARLVWVQQGDAAPPQLEGEGERVVKLPAPVGFAAAVNAGVAVAGELDAVAVLNDDLVLEPGWLGALTTELDRRPNAAAVQGVVVELARPERVDGCGIAWNRDWQAVQVGQGQAPPARDAASFEIFGASATAALYRSSALGAVANPAARLFDERLGSYYEDVELAVRLREAGFDAWCVPRARARHAGQATTGRAPAERWRLVYRNRRWVTDALLGERFAVESARLARRDRRDLARRLLAFDLAGARGLAAGLRDARRGSPIERAARGLALAAAERLAVGSPA